jgi:hypothetical protein
VPEEIEVETSDLQEAIDELHKERNEREAEEKQSHWTRYIGLTTAILAVFAAIGALRSGGLINEAMMSQLKASDHWNEYQAARQKSHLYTAMANLVLDGATSGSAGTPLKSHGKLTKKSPEDRLADYDKQISTEDEKSKKLSEEAKKSEKEAEALKKYHEVFAESVAFIQVAIALGAISALTKLKPVWIMSMLIGAAGVALCISGLIHTGF